jgi:predicted RNA-binding Zn-ribbon protein involved in translation (DUF1610 family)
VAVTFACPACGRLTQAPETLVGRRAECPLCHIVIEVPAPPEEDELVLELAEPATPKLAAVKKPSSDDDVDRWQCPGCGGIIPTSAALCRHCGMVFDHERASRRGRSPVDDDRLAAGDIVIGLIPCISWIGVVVGIVYLAQGRPKGWKMIALSLGASLAWIAFSVMSSLQRGRF